MYHGTLLEQADELAREPDLDLTPLEQQFLDASVTHLAEQLADGETSRVLALIEQLAPLAERACPRLVEIYQAEPPDSRRRLHAALALQCRPHAPRE